MSGAAAAPALLLNLWMLKARNGMFWYARDYVLRTGRPCRVLLRRGAPAALRQAVQAQGWPCAELGPWGFAREMLGAVRRGSLVFTPTPHPVPFVRNQVTVVHDPYPFQGRLGRLKRGLFRFGVRSSGCVVAYINRSLCLDFLAPLRLPGRMQLFAPNVPPRLARPAIGQPEAAAAAPRTLGAFGTDSRKKHYALLLAALAGLGDSAPALRIFGHENAYTGELRARFGAAAFTLVDADRTPLDEFMASVDAAVSVAEGEGFGRPLASAILAGMPCYLLDSPSFREFYEGLACLYADLPALLHGVARGDRARPVAAQGFTSPDYAHAIEHAVARLQNMAGG